MKKQSRHFAAIVLCLGAAFAAKAEEFYCTVNDNTSNYNRAFKNPSYWVDSNGTGKEEFSPECEYYACCTLYLSLSEGFAGGPLHIGCLATSTAGGALIYSGGFSAPNGFWVEKGKFTANRNKGWAHPVGGDMTVVSPSSAPFTFRYNYDNSSFVFKDAIIGDDDAAFAVDGNGKSNVGCTFSDLSRYKGLITATSSAGSATSEYNVKLVFKNTTFPGSLDMSQGTGVEMDSSVAGSTMSIGNMTLRRGTRIVVGGSAAAHGSYVATCSLTAESGVEVYLDFAVPISSEEQRLVLLSAPEGKSVFAKDDFVLNASKSDWKHHYRLETVVEGGVKSLVAVFEPLVQQTRSYPYENGFGVYENKNGVSHDCTASSMTNAAYWSDGQVPHGGVHYWTASNLRTPFETSAVSVFPGKSLTLASGGNLRIFYKEYTLTNLILGVSASVQFGNYCKIFRCEKIFVPEGSRLSLETYLGNVVEIDSEIVGDGSIWFSGIKRQAGTSSPSAHYVLRKPNPDYMGTVCVSQYIGEAGYIDFASKFQTLRIADGKCLGGKLAELVPNALTLANYSRLRTVASRVELEDGCNRGVYIQGCGRFHVDSADGGDTLVCNWPVTMNGALYKEGDGRLELGGSVSFQGEETIGDAPRANSNLFFVSKGALVPRRHDCCDGMSVSFAKDTKLVVPLEAENADLMKWGLYNVKEGGGVAIAEKLSVDFDLTACLQPPAKEFTLGIVTVANTPAAVEAIRGKLKISSRTYEGYRRAALVETVDSERGTVTFAAKFVQDGMSIVVR